MAHLLRLSGEKWRRAAARRLIHLTRPHTRLTFVLLLPWLAVAQPAATPDATPGLKLLDAVRTTLARDPAIQLQAEEVTASLGVAQEARGRFDTRLSSTVGQGLEHTPVRSTTNALNAGGFERLTVDRTTLRVGAAKLLRSGVEVSPGVQLTRVDDSLSGFDPENRAEVNFTVRVPLGRGLGRGDTGAEETAAQIAYEAARLDLRNVVALRLLNTAASYWNYLAATRRLEIVSQSELHARELITRTLDLVKAGEVPAAETNQLAANLADKTASRIATEQALLEARQALALAMGLPGDQLERLPPPVDPFPVPVEEALPPGLTAQEFIEQALSLRADLQSARLWEDSARTLSVASRRRLKPQVDLLLQVGYAGLDTGSQPGRLFASTYENIAGVNAFAGLNFEWPPANNAARGLFLQRDALYRQTVIRAADLERNIVSGVSLGLERLRNVMQEWKRSELAAREYETAVRNEKAKRQLGFSTFIDVVVLEDRLTSAALNHLGARLQHAVALARLRYETGLLLAGDAGGESLRLEHLTTLPPILRRAPPPKP
jgi:outer membrane protein TolC